MMMEGIPKRRASMSKTTRDNSNADTRLGEEFDGSLKLEASLADAMAFKDVVKMTNDRGAAGIPWWLPSQVLATN